MRVYIPGTVAELAVHTSGRWEPERGFAVTEALATESPDLDEEELAELAIDLAAEASALEQGSSLRLVIAADFSRADVQPDPESGPAEVRITGKLAATAVACIFMDEDDAAEDVTAARAGDDEALERLGERSLLWFELGELADRG